LFSTLNNIRFLAFNLPAILTLSLQTAEISPPMIIDLKHFDFSVSSSWLPDPISFVSPVDNLLELITNHPPDPQGIFPFVVRDASFFSFFCDLPCS